jgi:hypothetical protein
MGARVTQNNNNNNNNNNSNSNNNAQFCVGVRAVERESQA